MKNADTFRENPNENIEINYQLRWFKTFIEPKFSQPIPNIILNYES